MPQPRRRIGYLDRRLGVVANAIGYEMLRHDRPVHIGSFGVEEIDVTDTESQRCLAAARRVLDHLTAYDAGRFEVTHHCPPDGASVTPCCGRSPFDLPRTDRLTIDTDAVTCPQPDMRARFSPPGHPHDPLLVNYSLSPEL